MKEATPFIRQCWHFILHLRWHYQLFILSGGYLLGGYLSSSLEWSSFLLQFLNVHLLLFGGATAYNSYWDKDKGPVGGLRNPPPMEKWMWGASIMLQLVGLWLAWPAGTAFTLLYGISMLLFWLYSTPHARWKGDPRKSLVAIGISTGANSLLMGYLAANPTVNVLHVEVLIASAGVALIMLSLYPVSQLYQLREDSERGDRTFASRYGLKGAALFFRISFPAGLLPVAASMYGVQAGLALIFAGLGMIVYLWLSVRVGKLKGVNGEYDLVMRIKYGTSLVFVCFLALAILYRHTHLGIL